MLQWAGVHTKRAVVNDIMLLWMIKLWSCNDMICCSTHRSLALWDALTLWHVAAMVFSKVCEVHRAAVFCICLFCLSNGHAYVSRFKFAVNFSHEPHFNQAKLAGLATAGCGQEHNPWVDKPPVTLVFDGCPFHQINIESIRNDYLISVTIIVAALVCWHDPYSRPRLHPWHSVGLYLELKYLLDLCFI